jgi:hypothetical protein
MMVVLDREEASGAAPRKPSDDLTTEPASRITVTSEPKMRLP